MTISHFKESAAAWDAAQLQIACGESDGADNSCVVHIIEFYITVMCFTG